MFRRQTPLGAFRRLLGLVWPRLGWRRTATYFQHRLGRMSGSAHWVAAGLAGGVAAGILPIFGVQFLVAALLAIVARGSIVAALLGTFVGNPWTFPFLWLASYRIGRWLLPAPSDGAPPAFVSLFSEATRALLTLDWPLFVTGVWPIWKPMILGSLPLMVAGWLAAYWLTRSMVAAYQRRTEERRRRLRAETGSRQA